MFATTSHKASTLVVDFLFNVCACLDYMSLARHGHVYSPQPNLVSANAKCSSSTSIAWLISLHTKRLRFWLIFSSMYVHILTICLLHGLVNSSQSCLVCAIANCLSSSSTACLILLLTKHVCLWMIYLLCMCMS